MNELLAASLTDQTEALRARRTSPVELMQVVLDRIDATHSALNAIVTMYPHEKLLAEARAAEERIARGEARPLEGIPFGVKDLEDAAGLVTSNGSLPWKDNLVHADSEHVARLRRAGAIAVGKTNTPEFGYTAITKNLVYGVTRNPWNLAHTPGGSSGGSSAALAGCVLPLATASDGGGSIRIPASFTGAFGLKTSQGRVPITPLQTWPFQSTGVSGPLTKTVEDAALVLDQIAGPSPHDPLSLPPPGLSYLEAVHSAAPDKLRIAYSPDLGYAVVQSDIAQAIEDAVRVFEKLGHRVERISGGPPEMGGTWSMLGNLSRAGTLDRFLPEREQEFGRTYLAGAKAGWDVTPLDFHEAGRRRMELCRWCAGVFEQYDLLLTPTVPYDPPPAKGPFPAETEGRPQHETGVASFTIPFNMSLNPAASVRAGLSARGLPIGLQIVGPHHRDDLVLRMSRAFERERPWHPEWPVEFARLEESA